MNRSETAHRPILVAELLAFLAPRSEGHYADCSCGHGYFAERLAQSIPPGGRLLCIDINAEAVEATTRRLARFGERCAVVRGSYAEKSTTNGKDSSVKGYYTEVYAKRDGRWQCVTSYAEPLAP